MDKKRDIQMDRKVDGKITDLQKKKIGRRTYLKYWKDLKRDALSIPIDK